MPNPILLQAIHRLDQAVTRAETALDAAGTREKQRSGRRDAMIAEAMTEIDDLIALIRKSEHG